MFVRKEFTFKGDTIRSVLNDDVRIVCPVDACKMFGIDQYHKYLGYMKQPDKIKLTKQQLSDIGYKGQGNGLNFVTVDALIKFLTLDEHKNNDGVQEFVSFLNNLNNEESKEIPLSDVADRVSLLYDRLEKMERRIHMLEGVVVQQDKIIKTLEKKNEVLNVPMNNSELPKQATSKRHAIVLLIQEYIKLKGLPHQSSAWYDLTMNIKARYGDKFDFYKLKMEYEEMNVSKTYPTIFEEENFLDQAIMMMNWMNSTIKTGGNPLLFQE